jgi:hypothetical protein
MSVLDLEPIIRPAASSGGSDLIHVVTCCGPDRALCGADVPGDDYDPAGEYAEECVVCAELDRQGPEWHCVKCRACPGCVVCTY